MSTIDARQREDFLRSFSAVMEGAYSVARDRGWWDDTRSDGDLIALMHSELSEALEASRDGNPPDHHLPQFSAMEVEFADVIIRIMDAAAHKRFRLAEAIVAKIEYNKVRSNNRSGNPSTARS